MVLDMDPSISLPVLIPGVRVTGASQDTGHSHTHTQQRLRVPLTRMWVFPTSN